MPLDDTFGHFVGLSTLVGSAANPYLLSHEGRTTQGGHTMQLGTQLIGLAMSGMPASLVNLTGSGRYVHWGFIQISVANLILIGLMVLVFIAAIVIPFRWHRGGDQ
jgi:hypothetical protein